MGVGGSEAYARGISLCGLGARNAREFDSEFICGSLALADSIGYGSRSTSDASRSRSSSLM